MNRMTTLLSIATFLALGCQKEMPAPVQEPGQCHLTVGVSIGSTSETKVTDVTPGSETFVGSLQVFLYDGESLAGSGRDTCARVSVEGIRSGSYDLYVLANAPEAPSSSAATLSSLKGTGSSLGDNAPGRLVAFGSGSVDVGAGSNSARVQAVRLVSKVVLEKITNALEGPLAGARLTVHSVYVTNVAASCRLGGGSDSTYINRMGYRGGMEALTHDVVETDVASSIDVAHTFYVYENPVERDSVGGNWTPRRSRLVVDATVGGTHCYYVVTLPVLGRNRIYEIQDLAITRLGSDDEETVSEGAAVVVGGVTLSPWGTDTCDISFSPRRDTIGVNVDGYEEGQYNETL